VHFSIVIPLYNKARFIKRSLDSVLMQTLGDYEVIVIDDGSTDDGPDLVAGYSDHGIRLIRQENRGVSAARNRGIAEAQGEWIAFLDADDTLKPHYLQTIMGLIRRFPDAGAYATAYEIIMPNGKIIYPKYEAIPLPPWEGLLPSYFRSALGPPPVCTGAVTIHKNLFNAVGMFPVGIPVGEDLDMWGRIALRYPIAFSWLVGTSYRQDDRTRGNRAFFYFTNQEATFVRTAREAIEKSEVGSVMISELREYMAKLQIDIGRLCIIDGRNPMIARTIVFNTSPTTARLKRRRCALLLQSLFPLKLMKIVYQVKRKIQNSVLFHFGA
jgi:glycosyltransferase involved in cell wall biosynthesis